MQPKLDPHRETPTDERPLARKTEKLEALLRDIADDARGRAESYPQESVVPEGGE